MLFGMFNTHGYMVELLKQIPIKAEWDTKLLSNTTKVIINLLTVYVFFCYIDLLPIRISILC